MPFVRLSCALADGKLSSFERGNLPYRQCRACQCQCSAIAGSVFEATKLSLPALFRHRGAGCPSAWLMKHQRMTVMRLREDARQLSGRVELDDGYFGR